MKSEGYDEETLVNLRTGEEVYGQNGYGWYTYKGSEIAEEWERAGGELSGSKNPLFVYMDGATRSFFTYRGFYA